MSNIRTSTSIISYFAKQFILLTKHRKKFIGSHYFSTFIFTAGIFWPIKKYEINNNWISFPHSLNPDYLNLQTTPIQFSNFILLLMAIRKSFSRRIILSKLKFLQVPPLQLLFKAGHLIFPPHLIMFLNLLLWISCQLLSPRFISRRKSKTICSCSSSWWRRINQSWGGISVGGVGKSLKKSNH